MIDLSPSTLARIRAEAQKATPGPWMIDREDAPEGLDRFGIYEDKRDYPPFAVCGIEGRPWENATHIANCDPATVTALIDALTEARGEVERVREEVERHRSDNGYIIGWNAGWDHAWSEPLKFPTMLRKMWSGSEVQSWLDEQRRVARTTLTGGPNEPK